MTQTRTPEEIDQLKKSWLADPNWDIEDSDGFEAHREELLAFHKEQDAKWEAKWLEAENERIEKVMLATGVGKSYRGELLALHTFEEIEREVKRQDRWIGECGNYELMVPMTLAQLQIRATLLQASQLKRIADALEQIANQDDGTSLINSAKIWGSEK